MRGNPARRSVERTFERALVVFGETLDPREAGWILPDGRLLDFSGKNEGGPPGRRSYDHRDIGRALPRTAPSGTDGMLYFMRLGAVRMSVVSGYELFLDFAIPPTEAQEQAIRWMAEHVAEVRVDAVPGGDVGWNTARTFPPTHIEYALEWVRLLVRPRKRNPLTTRQGCYYCRAQVGARHRFGCPDVGTVEAEQAAVPPPPPAVVPAAPPRDLGPAADIAELAASFGAGFDFAENVPTLPSAFAVGTWNLLLIRALKPLVPGAVPVPFSRASPLQIARQATKELSDLLGRQVPFRAPHHTVSRAGLASEFQIAVGGVLYLDDFHEFSGPVREALADYSDSFADPRRLPKLIAHVDWLDAYTLRFAGGVQPLARLVAGSPRIMRLFNQWVLLDAGKTP